MKNLSCERDDRVLFAGLSLDASPGALLHVVGPNGAGKTTLLKILCGLSTHYHGQISWGDFAIPSYEYLSSLLFLGHQTGVNSSLTPLENLRWFFGLHGRKGATNCSGAAADTDISTAEFIAALNKVNLAGYEDFPCYQMSAGQQRRVALARLFISQAPIWILDEPFTAIDKQGVRELEQRIQNHRDNGGIVILTTHQAMEQLEPQVVDLAEYQTERDSAGIQEAQA
ncbi:MAG: cytochrome c biogenesis heme-transporting ATPase CcmA [Agarilytica sp.]